MERHVPAPGPCFSSSCFSTSGGAGEAHSPTKVAMTRNAEGKGGCLGESSCGVENGCAVECP